MNIVSIRDCPICSSNKVSIKDEQRYAAWRMNEYVCSDCHHVFLDNALGHYGLYQEMLNQYYTESKDSDLHDVESTDRLQKLADYVQWNCAKMNILDVGGKYSLLKTLLGCDTLGVGETIPKGQLYSCIVFSHVLEHVYDLKDLLDMCEAATRPAGWWVFEGPYWRNYEARTFEEYDTNWQHLQKFRIVDYYRLMFDHQMDVCDSRVISDFQGFSVVRIAGQKWISS